MKRNLLIIDNNDSILKLLSAVFNRKHTVFTASDGVEAMYFLYQNTKPDLIICDMNVNNINSYELVRHMSTSKIFNKIPVIILSGSDQDNEFFKQQSIVLQIVKKPFDPIALSGIVEEALSKSYQNTFGKEQYDASNRLYNHSETLK
ncbi:MAG TPA: response regulator [Flavipsychrobacter sp.]|nr:response regulator [Flavipsychrobacter sp.]